MSRTMHFEKTRKCISLFSLYRPNDKDAASSEYYPTPLLSSQYTSVLLTKLLSQYLIGWTQVCELSTRKYT